MPGNDPNAMQQLLQQLATHVHGSPQPFSNSSSSAPVPIPPSSVDVKDFIRRMRVTLCQMYEPILTEEERERARAWGMKDESNRYALERNAASSSFEPCGSSAALLSSSAAASSQPNSAATTTTASNTFSALVSAPTTARLHRFIAPLELYVDEFRANLTSMSRTIAYHSALIATAQVVAQTQKSIPQQNSTQQSALNQLSPLARSLMLYLKNRLELQRQHQKLCQSFSCVHDSIQNELQERAHRQALLSKAQSSLPLIPSSFPRDELGHFILPELDLYALTSSLAHIRSQLNLSNGADTEQPYSTLAPGAVPEPATASEILLKDFTRQRLLVNLSSTGVNTCFVLQFVLVRPVLQTVEERERFKGIVISQLEQDRHQQQVEAATSGSLGSVTTVLSSILQILRYGYCIDGGLTMMSGMDDVSEQNLDADFLSCIFHKDFACFRAKLGLLVANETLLESHAAEMELFARRKMAVTGMEALAQSAARTPTSTGPAAVLQQAFNGSLMRFLFKIEGPCLLFGYYNKLCPYSSLDANILSNAVNPTPNPSSFTFTVPLSATYIGLEKVRVRTLINTASGNEMDTSASNAPPSSTAAAVAANAHISITIGATIFALRFLLSAPVTLPLAVARQLFGEEFYSAALASSTDIPLLGSAAESSLSMKENCLHACLLEKPVRHLLDSHTNQPRKHKHAVFGSADAKVSFMAEAALDPQGPSALNSMAVTLTSFLLRDVNMLGRLIPAFRQAYLFQAIYRSAFIVDPTSKTATSSTASGTVAPSTLARSISTATAASSPSGTTSSAANQLAGGAKKKLKFSYRELLDGEASSDHAVNDANAMTDDQPASGTINVASLEEGDVLLYTPGSNMDLIRLSTLHPITRQVIQIEIHFAPLHLAPVAPESAPFTLSVSCSNASRLPSTAYLTKVLQATASLPIMVHYLLKSSKK